MGFTSSFDMFWKIFAFYEKMPKDYALNLPSLNE